MKFQSKTVWYELDMEGYYLPHLSSSVMTSDYLLKVMREKVLRIEKKDIQKCTFLQNSSKADLYIKLKELTQKLDEESRIHSRKFAKQRVILQLSVFEALDRRCWASDKGGFRIAQIA